MRGAFAEIWTEVCGNRQHGCGRDGEWVRNAGSFLCKGGTLSHVYFYIKGRGSNQDGFRGLFKGFEAARSGAPT